jgi:membrane protein YqaA with SNARE-associated domain
VKALKHFLIRYKAWIMSVLAPLGAIWAVLIIAFIDASFFGIPVDAAVIFYISAEPQHLFLLSVMAAIGSALGSSIPYLIGYLGGIEVAEKRLGRKRFAHVHALSEKYGDLALIIPALMPPGFPFKACVLIAGVTEMSYPHFLLAIFAGRVVRFLAMGILILLYGPEIFGFVASSFKHHLPLALLVTAAILALLVLAIRWFNRVHLHRLAAQHLKEKAEKAAEKRTQDALE